MDYGLLQVTKDPDSWHDSDDDELFGPEGDLASVHCSFTFKLALSLCGWKKSATLGLHGCAVSAAGYLV